VILIGLPQKAVNPKRIGPHGQYARANGKTPMQFNSINTNAQSILALQSLNRTNAELAGVQKRVSTGYRVADARDDGGAFAVAQSVRSDVAALTAVNEQLGGAKGLLQVTFAALSQVSDAMREARATLTRLADSALSTEQFNQYKAQYTALRNQISGFLNDAKYNGRSLLSPSAAGSSNPENIITIQNEDGGQFTINAIEKATLLIASAPANAAAAVVLLTSTASGAGNFQPTEDAIGAALNQLGTTDQYIEKQINFNKDKMDALNAGIGSLVDADLAKENARLQALQVRQQLGVQTLGIANQGPQVLLSLFR
jgi:flagellin